MSTQNIGCMPVHGLTSGLERGVKPTFFPDANTASFVRQAYHVDTRL